MKMTLFVATLLLELADLGAKDAAQTSCLALEAFCSQQGRRGHEIDRACFGAKALPSWAARVDRDTTPLESSSPSHRRNTNAANSADSVAACVLIVEVVLTVQLDHMAMKDQHRSQVHPQIVFLLVRLPIRD